MAAIPTEVIFVLLFIAFSVLDGVGRKRKAKERGAGGKPPAPRPQQPPPREPARAGAGPVGSESAGRPEGTLPQGSEGLIPKDVWAEILGLARGTPPEPGRADPEPDSYDTRPGREDETLEEIHPFEARTLEPVDFEDERKVSRPERLPVPAGKGPAKGLAARRGAALKASGAKAVAAAGKARVPTGAERPGGRSTGRTIRADLLGDGSPGNLRKAIILTEVLGLPVGLRE